MKSNQYKKEEVYRFDGLIESKYTFAGYEGSVILYKHSRVRYSTSLTSHKPQKIEDIYYSIEATLKAIANDYMYMSRPEFKIWGQHPFLTENDTLFFANNFKAEDIKSLEKWGIFIDRMMTNKILFDFFQYLMNAYVSIDSRYYYERVLYVLNGDIRLLEEPILVAPNLSLYEVSKQFDFIEGKKCIIEMNKDSFSFSNIPFFTIYYLRTNNNTTLKLNNLPRNEQDIADIIADIQSYKRPEIIYPHL